MASNSSTTGSPTDTPPFSLGVGRPEYTDNPKGLRQRAAECGCWVWSTEEDGRWEEQPSPPSWAQLEDALTIKLRVHRAVCGKE